MIIIMIRYKHNSNNMCFQRDVFHQKYGSQLVIIIIVQLMHIQTIATTAHCSGGVSRGVNITRHTHSRPACEYIRVFIYSSPEQRYFDVILRTSVS